MSILIEGGCHYNVLDEIVIHKSGCFHSWGNEEALAKRTRAKYACEINNKRIEIEQFKSNPINELIRGAILTNAEVLELPINKFHPYLNLSVEDRKTYNICQDIEGKIFLLKKPLDLDFSKYVLWKYC